VKPAEDVSTAAVTAVGLMGGWLVARETGIRPLGGLVLAAAGFWAGRTWLERDGAAVAAGLSAVYLAAFAASHPLAHRIGSWPSVISVTAVSSGAALAASDLRHRPV
jgi:thiol:disulfide interchange protein